MVFSTWLYIHMPGLLLRKTTNMAVYLHLFSVNDLAIVIRTYAAITPRAGFCIAEARNDDTTAASKTETASTINLCVLLFMYERAMVGMSTTVQKLRLIRISTTRRTLSSE
jgi:hypothetical protein